MDETKSYVKKKAQTLEEQQTFSTKVFDVTNHPHREKKNNTLDLLSFPCFLMKSKLKCGRRF